MLGAVGNPVNRVWRDPELMLEQAAHPERDGVEMGMDANTASAEILGAVNAGIDTHHDAAMIEAAMGKNRDRCDRCAATLESEILGDLQLADVEFQFCDETRMALGRWQSDYGQVQTWRRYFAVDKRAG